MYLKTALSYGPGADSDAAPEPPSEARVRALRSRLSEVRVALTVWVPFFGHLLLKLDPQIAAPEHGVKTMGVTRDRKLFLNVDWCETLSDAEFTGVLCHEVMHLAYLVFERQGPRRAVVRSRIGTVSLWNIAHDYAINGIIDTMTRSVREVALPEGGCMDHKYDGQSAEEIYDALIDEASNGGQGDGQGDGKNSTILLPEDSWGTDDLRDDLGGSGKGEARQKGLDQYWKVAVVEAAQVHQRAFKNKPGQGNLPAGLLKFIKDLTDPKVSWIDVLSRWVGENGRRADFTYRRPSRRSESVGEFMPSLQRHGVDDIVVLWDTSGSMNGREAEIFSEIIGICDDLNMSLRVICCDTEVHSDQEDVREVEDVDVKGGGGSNFTPAFDLLDEEGYQGVCIAFTDGYIGVPQVKPQHLRECLWVLWEGRDVDPTGGKWGEVLTVDTDGNQI